MRAFALPLRNTDVATVVPLAKPLWTTRPMLGSAFIISVDSCSFVVSARLTKRGCEL